LREVRGRPVILAWSRALTFAGDEAPAADALRAELRGLGAALVVVTPGGVWLLQPDDPPEALRPAARTDQAAPPTPPDATARHEPWPFTLLVLDDGAAGWRWTGAASGPEDGDTLLFALRRAAELRARDAAAPATMTRRTMLGASLAAALAAALAETRPALASPGSRPNVVPAGLGPVTLNVNGKTHSLQLEPRVTLLDALREQLGLTGTKKGCDHGQCGACTVLVDGRRIDSCLTLAIMQQGTKITTIEGLAREGLARGAELHPMQAAFLQHDGFQCGYCTPGQIMSAVGLLAEGHARSAADVREQMSGNLCRCGAYPNIVAAIEQVRGG
jgi:xanthine dehydrogenase YagT iron-sulfur-binding subunit